MVSRLVFPSPGVAQSPPRFLFAWYMGVGVSDCRLAVDLPRYVELDKDGEVGGRKMPGCTPAKEAPLPPPPLGRSKW